MTTRKRRPPEKRRIGRLSRLMASGASLIGTAAMRNPAATGGTAVFVIVFSFVAANALWYQPSSHPHPWIDTRDAFRDYASHAMHAGTSDMTTYRIERDPSQPAAAAQTAAAAPAETATQPAAAQAAANAAAAPAAEPVNQIVVQDDAAQKSDLVASVQANLTRRGLYDGPADGVMGPKTQAAIMFYQETRGLPETGSADTALLDLLKKDNAEFNIIPAERPTTDVTGAITQHAKAQQQGGDTVAALIKTTVPAAKPAAAPKTAAVVPPAKPVARTPVPPAPIPAAAPTAKPQVIAASAPAKPKVAAPAAPPAPADLVMAIQKGLSNLAYKDVVADGHMGDQTREAIRHFEMHYRLPVTGEPSQAVLDKLKKIGAL